MTRLFLLLAAICAAGAAIACAPPAFDRLDAAIFTGKTIVLAHGFPGVLGASTFTAPKSPWFEEGWIGGLVAYFLWLKGGYSAFIFGSTLLAAAALILTEQRVRQRGAGHFATGAALLVVIMMAWGDLRAGGNLVNLVFFAAFLLLIERAPSNSAYWIFPLIVVWCNTSKYGFIAPFFALFSGMRKSFGPTRSDRLRRLAFYLSPLAAMLMTPATIWAFPHCLAYLDLDADSTLVQSWQPALVSSTAFFGGFVPTVIAASWIGLRRAGIAETAVALGALLIALLNGHHLSAAGVAVGPVFAFALQNCREHSDAAQRRSCAHIVACAALGAFLFAGMATAFAGGRESFQAAEREPIRIVNELAADGRSHRVFCSAMQWCNHVLLHAPARLQVFIDGRFADYPLDVMHDTQTLARMSLGWRGKLRAWNIDTIVVPASSGMNELLAVLPDWKLVSASADVRAFERR